jgi:hypothetical protein
VQQAAFFDGLFFDPFSLQQNGLATSDVSGGAKVGQWSGGIVLAAWHMLFARSGPVGFLSHLRSLRRYDEQEILHVSLTPICLMNADAGQSKRY